MTTQAGSALCLVYSTKKGSKFEYQQPQGKLESEPPTPSPAKASEQAPQLTLRSRVASLEVGEAINRKGGVFLKGPGALKAEKTKNIGKNFWDLSLFLYLQESKV